MATKIDRQMLIMFIYDGHNKRDLAEHMYNKMSEEERAKLVEEYNKIYDDDDSEPTPWEHAAPDC